MAGVEATRPRKERGLPPTEHPCPGWLAMRLGELPQPAAVMVVDTTTSSGRNFTVPRVNDVIDLRHAPTRLAVLLNIAAAGRQQGQNWARPWVLQAPWAGEEDESLAACCVVAALQAIERGGSPPIGVLGAWPDAPQKSWLRWTRPHLLGAEYEPERTATEASRSKPQRELFDRKAREAGFLLIGEDL